MKISVHLVWYNGLGGHPAISFAGDFLLLGSSITYGSSFHDIEFYLHIPSENRLPGLVFLSDRFDERVRELPKSWIKRKLHRIEISYNSQLGTEEGLCSEKRQSFSSTLFSSACREIVLALNIIENKIKRSDDFQLDELRGHFRDRLQQLPKTDLELQTILQQLRLEERKRLLP